jgi:hypothetical protein
VPTPAVQCWDLVPPTGRAAAGVVVGASTWSRPTIAQDAFIGQDNVNWTANPAPTDPAVSFLDAAGELNLVSADPAQVRLRVSAGGRLAIEDCDLTRRQPKVFYADPALIAESNAWRGVLGRGAVLVPDSDGSAETVTITRNNNTVTLRRVMLRVRGAQGLAVTGTQNCDDALADALGGGGTTVVAPVGTAAFSEEMPEADIARRMLTPTPPAVGGPQAGTNEADTVRAIATAYGNALRNNTAFRTYGPTNLSADRYFGVNRYAAPQVGEGFCLASLPIVPTGATLINAQLSTDRSRPGVTPVLSSNSFWGYHVAGVVIRDGADVITLENYSRATEAAPGDMARARIGYYFQMYDTAPGAQAARTFHGSWTSAPLRTVNTALAADAGLPAGTTHRPVPNGTKTFTNPLTMCLTRTGVSYETQLPDQLGNLTDDQLRTAYTALNAVANPAARTVLTTVLKGLLYSQRLAAGKKPPKAADVAPWLAALGVLGDPQNPQPPDRRLRPLIAHTLARFNALPTV